MSLTASIKNVEMAANGLNVKQSIVDLLSELLTDSSFVANDFLSYIAGDFVSKENLGIEYENLKDSLDYVLSEITDGSLYASLSKILSTKDSIRQAVNELYKRDVIPIDPGNEYSYFEKYPEIIRDIPDFLDVRTTESVSIEENGEVVADDGKAYSSVVVSVPEKTLTTRVITENGTYYAQQDGADGYEWIQVGVTGNVPRHTVKFWNQDGTQILYTALDVPHGGYAAYDAAYPVSQNEDEYFTSWNPSPVNVTADMDCYPVFTNVDTEMLEIPDTWETIVQNKGYGYPLGSWKKWPPVSYDERITSRAVKVAVGEGGSTSTWLVIPSGTYDGTGTTFSFSILPYSSSEASDPYNEQITDIDTCGWRNSLTRSYLNSDQFRSNRGIPQFLWDAIIPVPKFSVGVKMTQVAVTTFYPTQLVENQETRDKIWIPSLKELMGDSSRKIISTVDASPYAEIPSRIRKLMDNSSWGLSYADVLFSSEIHNDNEVYAFNYPYGMLGDIYGPSTCQTGLRDCSIMPSSQVYTSAILLFSGMTDGYRYPHSVNSYYYSGTGSTKNYRYAPAKSWNAQMFGFCL